VRRSAVAALRDGRSSGGFALEATVAATRVNTPELACDFPTALRVPWALGAVERAGWYTAIAFGTGRRHRAREEREVHRQVPPTTMFRLVRRVLGQKFA
jgi:hypothetical protein